MMFKILFLMFFSFLQIALHAEVWLFRQEFVRFGKKSVYEELKKDWNHEYAKFFKQGKEIPPILAIEDLDNSEYIYLTPIFTYAALDGFSEKMQLFNATLKKELKLGFSSTINFHVESLQRYLHECSYIPEFVNASFCNMPYVHYQIFSTAPGDDAIFEDHLQKRVFEEQMKKSNLCWRVWKVAFGGDLPKYVVARFVQTKEALGDEEIQFVAQHLKEIIRSHREGKGILRRDLSVIIACDTEPR